MHDGLCQHLTATALAGQVLSGELAAKGLREAADAARIVELVEEGINLARLDGAVMAVDAETCTLVFKQPKKKPLLLDWNKDTEFLKDGNPSSASQLPPGSPVQIEFRNASFHNPLLKKVYWTSPAHLPAAAP